MKTQLREENAASVVKLGASRQVAIPKRVHDQLRLAPGDYLEVELRDNRLILTPKTLVNKNHRAVIDKRLVEGLEDTRKGRTYSPFSSAKALTRSLHREAGKLKKR